MAWLPAANLGKYTVGHEGLFTLCVGAHKKSLGLNKKTLTRQDRKRNWEAAATTCLISGASGSCFLQMKATTHLKRSGLISFRCCAWKDDICHSFGLLSGWVGVDVILVGRWKLWGTDEVYMDVSMLGPWMLWGTSRPVWTLS